MTTENRKKNAKIFLCEKCDYNTSNKYDYNRHLSTVKTQKQRNDNRNEHNK